jgi:mRNA-degrading endonuclease RelE of RelBE toxin-antitoxin system
MDKRRLEFATPTFIFYIFKLFIDMLKEQISRIKNMMRLVEATVQLDYDANYFIRRIPFLKTFKNFSNNKKIFFQKIDYNENVQLMVGDDLVTFPQFNTSMEFTYMKDSISTGGYRHMFFVKNDLHIMPPQTKDRQEELTFRVLLMAMKMATEKMEYRGDIITENPNLTEEQISEVINGINKAYFDFETFIQEKLNVNITNPLNETIDEDYPSSFNMEEFKQLKSFNQRIQYCEQNLQRISSGSSRIVYRIDDEKVLKLAKNKKGLAQNEAEVDFGTEFYLENIVAKIFEYDENGLWVEMELARKVTESDFKRITGYNFKDFAAAINNYHHSRTNFRNGYKMDVDPEIVAEMWEDEFVYEIFQYLGNYKVPVGDLTRLSTYGIVKRDGQDMVVLIDYGLTNEVYKTHYSE